jgi:hypothetical protein
VLFLREEKAAKKSPRSQKRAAPKRVVGSAAVSVIQGDIGREALEER